MDDISNEPVPPANNQVVDPHPSDEEHYDRIPHPGGVPPLGKDIGPNPAKHDGKPTPKPKNVDG